MMVDRRTGVVVLALLAIVFLFTSHADSMAMSSVAGQGSWARGELNIPHRLSGSVFSPTGDPDEIATVHPHTNDGGKVSGEFGDLIDARLFQDEWGTGRVVVRGAFLVYLAHFLQVAW